jgi:hypothetical protein
MFFILLCNLSILPLVFITLEQFNLINQYLWYSIASVIFILTIFFSVSTLKTLKFLKFLNYLLLLSLIFLLFYNLGFDLLENKSISLSLKSQLILLSLSLSFWILTFLINNKINLEQQEYIDDYERIKQNFLQPSIIFSLLSGIVLTITSLLLLQHFAQIYPALATVEAKFLERGIIPFITLLMFFWGLLLLSGKLITLLQQKMRPKNSSLVFILNNSNSLDNHFWTMLNDMAESFYDIPRYINYAIPILGFIGTVLGISLSAEGIANIISSPEGLTTSNQDLGAAISPLGIAFDTTLIALSLGLVLSLLQTVVQKFEISALNKLQSQHN